VATGLDVTASLRAAERDKGPNDRGRMRLNSRCIGASGNPLGPTGAERGHLNYRVSLSDATPSVEGATDVSSEVASRQPRGGAGGRLSFLSGVEESGREEKGDRQDDCAPKKFTLCFGTLAEKGCCREKK